MIHKYPYDLDTLDALDEFQNCAHETAIYPTDHALAYLLFGLFNEVGEFGNATDRDLATAELGDIYWFVAELATLIGTSLSVLATADPGTNEFGEYWNPPVGDVVAMGVFTMEFLDLSGFVAKSYRDHSDYANRLSLFLTRALLTLDSVADVMGVEVQDVLNSTITKLADRKERGVLRGSGDRR